MLFDVGMIRRALQSDVQGNLDPMLPGFLHQSAEILQRAQGRQNILVTTFRGADGPGAADIIRWESEYYSCPCG
jgi:hypothetical protein